VTKRVALAYSGGLDTSVAVGWLAAEIGYEVVAVVVDVGQDVDFDALRERATAAGAVEVVVVDAREELLRDFAMPALAANALYEGRYPLVSALSRPVIVRHLVAAARRHGPNKVCSAFVVGLEPLESLLAGAEYAARRGIVPLFSIWMPHGRPVRGSTTPPGLDYYRQARQGFAELFVKYKLEPPGASGLNVCMCRDLARRLEFGHL